jgi:hypothetical protein
MARHGQTTKGLAMRTRSLHLAALPLLAGITLAAGCGAASSSLPAALHDPSTQGVEALRETMRSALLTHDTKEQCELLAPDLLQEDFGRTVGHCTKLTAAIEGMPFFADTPYETSPSVYVAGASIAMNGNTAVYGNDETVFRAVYTDGAWKIVN